VPFEGSYLWQLRQKVGSALVLIPGAMVFLVRDDGAVLFTRRADNGQWCLPAGGAEEGSSFAATALIELREETGVEVDPAVPDARALGPRPRPLPRLPTRRRVSGPVRGTRRGWQS
jgi:8-oxo-dGTP pyrophosphatase MutT (NUDIX family)